MLRRKQFVLISAMCLCGAANLALAQEPHGPQNSSPSVSTYTAKHEIMLQSHDITLAASSVRPPGDPGSNPQPSWYHIGRRGKRKRFEPAGADRVRAVLDRFKPVPHDRVAFFRSLDDDPLSQQYPRGGWFIYVRDVTLREDGWIAEVMTNVWFDARKATGVGIPRVSSFWAERYQWNGAQLLYLGGHPEPPALADQAPFIDVGGR